MASLSQRVIRDDIDISAAVNSYAYENAATMDLPTSGDYLYIGSEVPFNNLWFQLHTANNTTTQVAIDTWWGQQWTPCVDIVDETAVSGVSLAKHGRIQWSLDDLKGWDCEDRSADVPGLENTKIYNMYWARFSWNNGVPPTTLRVNPLETCGREDLAAVLAGRPDIVMMSKVATPEQVRELARITGVTPSRWIREHRLRRASEMLRRGQYDTVTEVAAAVGMSRAWFTRMYRAWSGHSPGEDIDPARPAQ